MSSIESLFGFISGMNNPSYGVVDIFAIIPTKCKYAGQTEWVWLKHYYVVFWHLQPNAYYTEIKMSKDQFTIFKLEN